ALARLRLQHVLWCARVSGAVEQNFVVTADQEVVAVARTADAGWIPQSTGGGGLNGSLASAYRSCRERGAVAIGVLFADLPLLQPYELAAAVGQLEKHPRSLLIAPSVRGGTALLAAGESDPPEFVFGNDSFR